MKKFLAILLSAVLMLSLTTTAFAADADLTGHTYKAYQIFSGTQAAGVDKLGNIQWGSGVNGAALLSALKSDTTFGNTFTNCDNAAAVADAMAGWTNGSTEAKAFAKLAYANKNGDGVTCQNGMTTLDAGYYLVVDTTVFEAGAENTVYNLALLQLTNKDTFEIANKTSVPEVVKKVDDKNDSNTTEDAVEWQDSADYDINDHVPFQLKATLASHVTDYVTSKVVFHDTLSKGLTYDEGSYKVYLGEGEGRKDITDSFTINVGNYSEANGTQITFTCNDVTVAAVGAGNNAVIVVEYTATLTEKANIGAAGNPNKVYLEYSNNPNNSESGDNTGKTPEDKVIVFTYKVVVDKVTENSAYDATNDENGDGVDNAGNEKYLPLEGAGFTLYKKAADDSWAEVSDGDEDADNEISGAAMTTFEWKGLDDGDYKLVETTTPPRLQHHRRYLFYHHR